MSSKSSATRMTSHPIRLYLGRELRELHAVPPTRTVLEWLREDAGLTGTKEGCAEGDCGACTVLLHELDEHGGLRSHAINSCIQFMPTLDGKQLVTVEHLAQADGPLHPAQAALVDAHGSQCGFCTPGFVMSLAALYEDATAQGATQITRGEAEDALAGNLCRCTGYRPIVDAACAMLAAPPAASTAVPVDALRALQRTHTFTHTAPAGTFIAPRTADALAQARAAHPQAQLVAGTTDVGLWVTKQHRPLTTLIYTGHVAELRVIDDRGPVIHIGAAVAWTDLLPLFDRWLPHTARYWARFASPPVRNSATLGGNVANGSPIGDGMPVLIALDAQLVLQSVRGLRRVALEDFYLGYQKTALAADEFIRAIEFPRPAPASTPGGQHIRAYKLSKRFDQDISCVALGLALQLDGERIADVRIGVGGMAATPRRARATEAALRGQPWDAATLAAAQAAFAGEFSPIDDLRASRSYRMQAAQSLLQRFWLETSPLASSSLPAGAPISLDALLAREPAA
jgi:xanthine dehydrogenase small subunit